MRKGIKIGVLLGFFIYGFCIGGYSALSIFCGESIEWYRWVISVFGALGLFVLLINEKK